MQCQKYEKAGSVLNDHGENTRIMLQTVFDFVTAASQSATLLSMIVEISSEMHVDALCSLTQPCLTAYCFWRNTPMIQALYQALQITVSLGKCICIQYIKKTVFDCCLTPSTTASWPRCTLSNAIVLWWWRRICCHKWTCNGKRPTSAESRWSLTTAASRLKLGKLQKLYVLQVHQAQILIGMFDIK